MATLTQAERDVLETVGDHAPATIDVIIEEAEADGRRQRSASTVRKALKKLADQDFIRKIPADGPDFPALYVVKQRGLLVLKEIDSK